MTRRVPSAVRTILIERGRSAEGAARATGPRRRHGTATAPRDRDPRHGTAIRPTMRWARALRAQARGVVPAPHTRVARANHHERARVRRRRVERVLCDPARLNRMAYAWSACSARTSRARRTDDALGAYRARPKPIATGRGAAATHQRSPKPARGPSAAGYHALSA